jgi:hypothetical protein
MLSVKAKNNGGGNIEETASAGEEIASRINEMAAAIIGGVRKSTSSAHGSIS